MNTPKLWLNLYDFSFDYKGVEPSFIDESFAWSVEFEANWQVVLGELNQYLKNHRIGFIYQYYYG
jgi:hypothetical protein